MINESLHKKMKIGLTLSKKKVMANGVDRDKMAYRQTVYRKTCLKRPLKNRQNTDLNDKWKLNDGRKYFRMLPLEHSAILLTCIKRLLVLKTNL